MGIERIGIVGLGLLGTALVDRLHSQGFALFGFDIRLNQHSKTQGCNDATEVFERCDTVILCLPSSPDVQEVLEEAQEVLTPDHIVVDTTTGDPSCKEALHNLVASHGTTYVEACIAGSSDQMRTGEAVLFTAWNGARGEVLSPLFDAMGRRHYFVGHVGEASRMKLVHNMAIGLHRAVLAETLSFAKSFGMDPKTVLNILQNTPAASKVMDTKGPRMVTGHFAHPSAKLSQHLKDVRLMMQEAERTGARLTLTPLHRSLLEEAEAQGWADEDNSAIIKVFEPDLQM